MQADEHERTHALVDPEMERRSLNVRLQMARIDYAEARSPRAQVQARADADKLLDEYLTRYGRPAETG